MSKRVNRIRNADFSRGKSAPTDWTWVSPSKGARWWREPAGESGVTGVSLTLKSTRGSAFWAQTVVCKPEQYYRIEATVSASLTPKDATEASEGHGVVLSVEPMRGNRPTGGQRITRGILRATEPIAIRTYYETPPDVRRLRIRIGIDGAKGTARIDHVRFIEMLDPDEESNILAIPAPPHTLAAPKVARRVCVCSERATDRPITPLLRGYFGAENVETIDGRGFHPQSVDADAILIPDAEPPESITSLTKLKALSKRRIVVISLNAFARLSENHLKVRRVEQDDDPICAKVTYANHATRGFALHDTFSFAWPGDTRGSFVQNHIRRSAEQKAFVKKHRLVTLLESVCDRDATCDRPVCLFHETEGGALYVLDIEPAEAVASTFGEPVLAMHLLLSVLGQTQNSLGQYIVPEESLSEFRELIRETGVRFDSFCVHDSGLPTDEIKEQSVTIGREDTSFGLPLAPKPMILVRTGLNPNDMEAAYGAYVWFKQFVRMVPHVCPYADRVASQYRLGWIPWQTSWAMANGWRRPADTTVPSDDVPPHSGSIALLVDIVSTPANSVGMVLPSHESKYQRYVHWLPRVFATFVPGHYFLPSVNDGEDFGDRDAFAWRLARHEPQLIIDPAQFQSGLPRKVLAAGGQAVRLEVPGCAADFTAYSIQRTDLVATLLEQVIGLQYGLVAVNRSASPVSFNGFSPVAPGEALIVDHQDPMLRADASQAG